MTSRALTVGAVGTGVVLGIVLPTWITFVAVLVGLVVVGTLRKWLT